MVLVKVGRVTRAAQPVLRLTLGGMHDIGTIGSRQQRQMPVNRRQPNTVTTRADRGEQLVRGAEPISIGKGCLDRLRLAGIALAPRRRVRSGLGVAGSRRACHLLATSFALGQFRPPSIMTVRESPPFNGR
jgi:hypothetical protein